MDEEGSKRRQVDILERRRRIVLIRIYDAMGNGLWLIRQGSDIGFREKSGETEWDDVLIFLQKMRFLQLYQNLSGVRRLLNWLAGLELHAKYVYSEDLELHSASITNFLG